MSRRDQALADLLRPMTDKEAGGLPLVTRKQIEGAIRSAPRPLPWRRLR